MKKMYQKPTTNVVKLQASSMLMTSGVDSERRSYGTRNEGVAPAEQDGQGNWLWN